MNPRYVAILAVLVFGIVAAAYFFLQLPPPAALPDIVTPVPLKIAPPPSAAPVAETRVPAPTDGVTRVGSSPAAPPPPAEWEQKIDRVLTTNLPEADAAKMLINLLPTLPTEGQVEAAEHISHLIVENKDYGQVLPLLRNPALPPEVQDVLVTDLMNRDDTLKLPALLDIAKIPNHPHQEEALNDLQIFLDQDNGNNWAKWDTAVKAYLQKQAQEQAALENPQPEPVK